MIDTVALREKVLDLAIRGKLVPQDPNDEPASVLLERIRAQKQQMVKDGKLKAKDIKDDSVIFVGEDNLHYEKFADGTIECIEDQIPFELPGGWAWSKINNIAFVTKLAGFEYSKYIAPTLCEEGIPLFKGKNVQDSKIIYEFESFIPESISDELSRSQITRKCILTPYVGTIGNIGIHDKVGKFHLGSNVGKIELYNSGVVLMEEYVVTYLKSSFGYKQLTKHMKATAQASISIEAIRDVYIPIPPENEQQRMWSAISESLTLIETIESYECDIADIVKLAKAKILDLAIRGKLIPQNPDDEPASVLLERIRAEKEELIKQGKIKRDKKESVIFKGEDNSYYEKISEKVICIDDELSFSVPESWSWTRLGNIVLNYDNQRRPITKHNRINDLGLYDYYGATGAIDKVDSYIFDGEYLMIGEDGGNFFTQRDNSFIASGRFWANNHVHIVQPVACNIWYLKHFLDSCDLALMGLITGIGVPKLNQENMNKILVPIPPIEEQDRIADKVKEIYSVLSKAEKSLV